ISSAGEERTGIRLLVQSRYTRSMPESTAPPRLRVPGAPLTFQAANFSRPRPNGHKRPPSGQRFHLWVSGCQMNESDADYLTQGMTAAGFSAVSELDQADIAILVTCS